MTLLLLFIGHYSNVSLFYHTHTIDGITYGHSHFYWLAKASNPVQLPTHTQEQLKLIQDANHLTWSSDIELPSVENPVFTLLQELESPKLPVEKSATLSFTSLRGPPSLVC